MIRLKVKKLVLVKMIGETINSIYKHSMLNINVYATYENSKISKVIDFGKSAIKVLENITDSLLFAIPNDLYSMIVNYYCKIEIPTIINNYQVYIENKYGQETVHDSKIMDKLLDISLICKNTLEEVIL